MLFAVLHKQQRWWQSIDAEQRRRAALRPLPVPAQTSTALKNEFTVDPSKFPATAESFLSAETVDTQSDVIRDANGTPIASIPASAALARPQSAYTSTPINVKPVNNSEPVGSNGEFTVDETDLALPGFGIPFVFERHYRSGIDFQTPLGYGWNHTFGRRLIEINGGSYSGGASNCSMQQDDIIYLDDRMNRIRFVYQSRTATGIDQYASAAPGPTLTLSVDQRNAQSPWLLTDTNGIRYRFDRVYGTLSAIEGVSGTHSLIVAWDRTSWAALGGKPISVTDTNGKTIYFVYAQQSYSQVKYPYSKQPNNPTLTGQYEYLKCLNFTNDCNGHPLVSFQTALSLKVQWDFRGETLSIPASIDGAFFVDNTSDNLQFDLVHVADADGNGPSYVYYSLANWTRPDPTTSPRTSNYQRDSDVDSYCHSLCDSQASNCHNVDLCQQLVRPFYQSVCNGMENPYGWLPGAPTDTSCNDFCRLQPEGLETKEQYSMYNPLHNHRYSSAMRPLICTHYPAISVSVARQLDCSLFKKTNPTWYGWFTCNASLVHAMDERYSEYLRAIQDDMSGAAGRRGRQDHRSRSSIPIAERSAFRPAPTKTLTTRSPAKEPTRTAIRKTCFTT